MTIDAESFVLPAITLSEIPAEARFTRPQAAKVLTACGLPCSPKTLASQATRGGGPEYQRFGKFVSYTGANLAAWARAKLGKPASSASEHRTKGGSEP
jgi:hypothetical protein